MATGGMRESTAWSRAIAAPVRSFLRTEAGSAGVLVSAIVAALIWANVADGSYEAFWRMELRLAIGDLSLARDLRTWVNSSTSATCATGGVSCCPAWPESPAWPCRC